MPQNPFFPSILNFMLIWRGNVGGTTKLCHEALRIGSSAVFSDGGEKSSNKDLLVVALCYILKP
jgi:hypothetical protein